jgi:hypothetical protein
MASLTSRGTRVAVLRAMKSSLAVSFAPLVVVLVSSAAHAAEPTPPSPPPPPKQVQVTLRVDDAHAHLEQRTGTMSSSDPLSTQLGLGGIDTWKTVCAAPCNAPVDATGTYRVAGDGLVPTASFGLAGASDRVELDSRSGSTLLRVGGALLAVAGGAGIVVGGGSFGAALVMDHDQTGSGTLRDSFRYGGMALVGAGAIATVVGVYLFMTNESHVQTDSGIQIGKAGPKVTATGLVF